MVQLLIGQREAPRHFILDGAVSHQEGSLPHGMESFGPLQVVKSSE